MENDFQIGDIVFKPQGYAFKGEVRAVFTNRNGGARVVVELVNPGGNGDAMLHIFLPTQIRKA